MSDRPLLLKDVVDALTGLVRHQRSIREPTLFDAGVRADLTFIRLRYRGLPDSITRRLTEIDAEAMKEDSSKVYALAGAELREHVERVAGDAAYAQTIRAANYYREKMGLKPFDTDGWLPGERRPLT